MNRVKVIISTLEAMPHLSSGWLTTTGDCSVVLSDWFRYIADNFEEGLMPQDYKVNVKTQDGSKYVGVWPCEYRPDRIKLKWDIAEYPEVIKFDLSELDMYQLMTVTNRMGGSSLRGNGTHVVKKEDVKHAHIGELIKPWTWFSWEWQITDPMLIKMAEENYD